MNLQTQYQGTTTEARARDYKVGGVSYQRVSTILNVINKPALVGWMKNLTLDSVRDVLRDTDVLEEVDSFLTYGSREPNDRLDSWIGATIAAAKERTDRESIAARDRGTAIHADIVRALLDRGVWEYPETRQAAQFLEDNHMIIEAQEIIVWDDDLKVAGTADAVLRDPDGKLVVVDWKSGKGPYPEMALQLSAYATMLSRMLGEPVEEGLIVKVAADGYSVHRVVDLAEGWRVFCAAADLQRSLRQEFWA